MSVLLHELTLQGLLSFGPETPTFQLMPLNVLIGPNGSGKSNLIEAIDLLRSAASKLGSPMRGTGGGVGEWIWKGEPGEWYPRIEAVIANPFNGHPVRHRLAFTDVRARFVLLDEVIEEAEPAVGQESPQSFYRFEGGRPVLAPRHGEPRRLKREDVAEDESILSQRNEPDQYPQLALLTSRYKRIRLYREWSFGRSSIFRAPQPADMPSDRLEEDFSNLGLFLNHLRGDPSAKKEIIERLGDLYEGLDDFDVRVKGGTVEVFLTEADFTIPAGRLSDGTLRYLCLLAILCDPDPPPLICIEEPELGLHPDILPKIADLLVAASERTQLIVTTHSDILVDALTERPASVVVVEKHGKQTTLRGLDARELKTFLEGYRLGQLWMRGEIGGTRW